MPGKAILHRKNVFCNLSRHTIASIKAIHIIESSHPREDFFIPRPQAHQQINPAAAMQHTTTRFQVCTDGLQRSFIKEKRLWNSLTLRSKFFRPWL